MEVKMKMEYDKWKNEWTLILRSLADPSITIPTEIYDVEAMNDRMIELLEEFLNPYVISDNEDKAG